MSRSIVLMSVFSVLFFLSPFIFAKTDSGGLFVEPGLTYESGDSKIDYPAPFGDSDESANGFGLLGRFGVHIHESFFVAVDGRYKWIDFNDSANGYDANATAYNIAPVVGIQMPNVGLRLWASYVLLGVLDPESNNGTDLKFEDGKGLRIGGGFRIFSLSLNLEYEDLEYGRTVIEQAGIFGGLGSSDAINLDNKSYILSLSFPLEL